MFIWLVKCVVSIDPRIKDDNSFITKTSGKWYISEKRSPTHCGDYNRANAFPMDVVIAQRKKLQSQREGRGGRNSE